MSQDVEVGLRNGFWFFFEVDGHQVSVHNSAISGRERIWIDDELVASRLSWRKRSEHTINIGGRPIELSIAVPSWTAGRVICTLSHGGEEIARSEKQVHKEKAAPWAILASLLLGMATGYLTAKWGIEAARYFLGVQ